MDKVLLNAEIRLYEKGLQILTGLSNDSLFVKWHSVISCTTNRQSVINLTTNEGVIKLQKVKKETDIVQFSKILKSTVPEIGIEYVTHCSPFLILFHPQRYLCSSFWNFAPIFHVSDILYRRAAELSYEIDSHNVFELSIRRSGLRSYQQNVKLQSPESCIPPPSPKTTQSEYIPSKPPGDWTSLLLAVERVDKSTTIPTSPKTTQSTNIPSKAAGCSDCFIYCVTTGEQIYKLRSLTSPKTIQFGNIDSKPPGVFETALFVATGRLCQIHRFARPPELKQVALEKTGYALAYIWLRKKTTITDEGQMIM